MSRRYSPRALNSRTNASESESFELAYDQNETWSVLLDSTDIELDVDLDEDYEDDEYVELTETEYDDDWDDYWRRRRGAGARRPKR